MTKKHFLTLTLLGAIILGLMFFSALPGSHLLSSILDGDDTFNIVDDLDGDFGKPLSEMSQAELEDVISVISGKIGMIRTRDREPLATKIAGDENLLSVARSSIPALTLALKDKENEVKRLGLQNSYDSLNSQIAMIESEMATKRESTRIRKTFCEELTGRLPGVKTQTTTEKNTLTIDARLERPESIPSLKAAIAALEKEQKVWEDKKKLANALIERKKYDPKKQKALYNTANAQVTLAKNALITLGLKQADITALEKMNLQEILTIANAGLDILLQVSVENPGRIPAKKKTLDIANARLTELNKTLTDITSCPGEIRTIQNSIQALWDKIYKPTSGQRTPLIVQRETAKTKLAPRDQAKKDLEDAEKVALEYPAKIEDDKKKLKEYDDTIALKEETLEEARRLLGEKYQVEYDKLSTTKYSLEGQLVTLQEQIAQFQQELWSLDQTPVQEQVITYDDNGEEIVSYRETNPNGSRATGLGKSIANAETLVGNLGGQLSSIHGSINTLTQAAQKSGVGLDLGGSLGGKNITSGTGGATTGGYTGGEMGTSGTDGTMGGVTGGSGTTGTDGGSGGITPTEICNNSEDDDADQRADCSDSDCRDDDYCKSCDPGMVRSPDRCVKRPSCDDKGPFENLLADIQEQIDQLVRETAENSKKAQDNINALEKMRLDEINKKTSFDIEHMNEDPPMTYDNSEKITAIENMLQANKDYLTKLDQEKSAQIKELLEKEDALKKALDEIARCMTT